jgi:hypothetical protein
MMIDAGVELAFLLLAGACLIHRARRLPRR